MLYMDLPVLPSTFEGGPSQAILLKRSGIILIFNRAI